jgi:hypothetical protein
MRDNILFYPRFSCLGHDSIYTTEYKGLSLVTSTLGTVVATIIGYYFGNKPVEQANQSASNSLNQLKNTKAEIINQVDDNLNFLKDQKYKIQSSIVKPETVIDKVISNPNIQDTPLKEMNSSKTQEIKKQFDSTAYDNILNDINNKIKTLENIKLDKLRSI